MIDHLLPTFEAQLQELSYPTHGEPVTSRQFDCGGVRVELGDLAVTADSQLCDPNKVMLLQWYRFCDTAHAPWHVLTLARSRSECISSFLNRFGSNLLRKIVMHVKNGDRRKELQADDVMKLEIEIQGHPTIDCELKSVQVAGKKKIGRPIPPPASEINITHDTFWSTLGEAATLKVNTGYASIRFMPPIVTHFLGFEAGKQGMIVGTPVVPFLRTINCNNFKWEWRKHSKESWHPHPAANNDKHHSCDYYQVENFEIVQEGVGMSFSRYIPKQQDVGSYLSVSVTPLWQDGSDGWNNRVVRYLQPVQVLSPPLTSVSLREDWISEYHCNDRCQHNSTLEERNTSSNGTPRCHEGGVTGSGDAHTDRMNNTENTAPVQITVNDEDLSTDADALHASGTPKDPPNSLNNRKLMLVSYNILSDMYHEYDPDQLLSKRMPLILTELLAHSPDIACLQEVDEKVYHLYLKPVLSHDYESSFAIKENLAAEGCATFWRSSALSSVAVPQRKVVADLVRDDPALESILSDSPECRDIILHKVNTIAQVLELKHKQTDAHFLVANTHLFYHPHADHIRALQVHALIKCLSENSDKLPFLLFGDLNSDPNAGAVRLMMDGKLDKQHECWEYLHSYSWEGDRGAPPLEESNRIMNRSVEPETTSRLKLPSDRLESLTGFPAFTNYAGSFIETLDYILLSGRPQNTANSISKMNKTGEPRSDLVANGQEQDGKVRVSAKTDRKERLNKALIVPISSAPMPDPDHVHPYTRMPCPGFPSDHVPVACQVLVCQEPECFGVS